MGSTTLVGACIGSATKVWLHFLSYAFVRAVFCSGVVGFGFLDLARLVCWLRTCLSLLFCMLLPRRVKRFNSETHVLYGVVWYVLAWRMMSIAARRLASRSYTGSTECRLKKTSSCSCIWESKYFFFIRQEGFSSLNAFGQYMLASTYTLILSYFQTYQPPPFGVASRHILVKLRNQQPKAYHHGRDQRSQAHAHRGRRRRRRRRIQGDRGSQR